MLSQYMAVAGGEDWRIIWEVTTDFGTECAAQAS